MDFGNRTLQIILAPDTGRLNAPATSYNTSDLALAGLATPVHTGSGNNTLDMSYDHTDVEVIVIVV